jgi:hypothetical protein
VGVTIENGTELNKLVHVHQINQILAVVLIVIANLSPIKLTEDLPFID